MESTLTQNSTATKGTSKLWAGRLISGLCILFFLFDAVIKIIKDIHAIEASIKLGLPEQSIQGIGIVLLICTVLYAFPRTAILGAVLLTGYLGGAIAIMVRAEQSLYFALVFGILVWLGLYLRDERLRVINPFIRG